MNEEKVVYFERISEWRKWLSENCEKENRIAIIHYRGFGKTLKSSKKSFENPIKCFEIGGYSKSSIRNIPDCRL